MFGCGSFELSLTQNKSMFSFEFLLDSCNIRRTPNSSQTSSIIYRLGFSSFVTPFFVNIKLDFSKKKIWLKFVLPSFIFRFYNSPRDKTRYITFNNQGMEVWVEVWGFYLVQFGQEKIDHRLSVNARVCFSLPLLTFLSKICLV